MEKKKLLSQSQFGFRLMRSTSTDLVAFTDQIIESISWFRSNFLMLNVSKTKIMLIGTHQRLYTVDSFSVTADNTGLERVDTFKYLGVLMDQTLSWKEHISSMGKKISSRLAILRRAREVLPKSSCRTLYNTMVLSLFDYCAVVSDSCGLGSKSYLDGTCIPADGI